MHWVATADCGRLRCGLSGSWKLEDGSWVRAVGEPILITCSIIRRELLETRTWRMALTRSPGAPAALCRCTAVLPRVVMALGPSHNGGYTHMLCCPLGHSLQPLDLSQTPFDSHNKQPPLSWPPAHQKRHAVAAVHRYHSFPFAGSNACCWLVARSIAYARIRCVVVLGPHLAPTVLPFSPPLPSHRIRRRSQ